MKYVSETLNQFYDYKFFRVFEEKEVTDLKSREQDGLKVIDKIKKNFDEFKKDAKDEILKYKEFWEENKQNKEAFSETGDIYKLYNSNFVIGVLELPVETLSDGSIDGGFGETEDSDEEIIEGKEINNESEENIITESETFYEEHTVNNENDELNEADDDDLDLDFGDEDTNLEDETDETDETDLGDEEETEDMNLDDETGETDDLNLEDEEDTGMGDEIMQSDDSTDDDSTSVIDGPQTYFVVYDITGDEREEIFRCGSNNVINAFREFYNDTFKGSMKNAILKYKEAKEAEKLEAEKSEKKKAESTRDSKFKKFLGNI